LAEFCTMLARFSGGARRATASDRISCAPVKRRRVCRAFGGLGVGGVGARGGSGACVLLLLLLDTSSAAAPASDTCRRRLHQQPQSHARRTCSVMRLITRVTGRPLDTAGWKVSNLMYLCARVLERRAGARRTWHPACAAPAQADSTRGQHTRAEAPPSHVDRAPRRPAASNTPRLAAPPTPLPRRQHSSPVAGLAVTQPVDAVACDAAPPQHLLRHSGVDRLQGRQRVALDLLCVCVAQSAVCVRGAARVLVRACVL
jgi:hypothetical protein